jgi:catechol 2,3-dioxygenase-like lactoylglutathione lyase family enzyme
MITGLAHVAVCVPDVDAAVAWYESVLGLRVLSPPYLMAGDAIDDDMGELVPRPVVLKAAIVGVDRTDQVIELIEYPNQPPEAIGPPGELELARTGPTHIGLLCDDVETTRARLADAGVELLTSRVAAVAGVRTAWFRDPWGVVFILVEKSLPDRPYWRQY